MKKLLSIVLALVMALSAISITALAADDYADFDGTITLGETRPVNLPGLTQYSKYVFIQFIPEKDGLYAISSDSRENPDCDPYLELYVDKKESNYVAKVDDANNDTTDFYLEYYFEAGTVYYFVMGNYRSATVWDITLECLHEEYEDGKCVSCNADCDHVKVNNMFNSCPCGKTFDGANITVADGKYTANVRCKEGEYTFFKFVPEKTGIFHATTNGASDKIDPCCDVYDAQGNLVAYHDNINADTDKNFDLVCQLQEGETYFVGICDNAGNQREWSFTFEDISTHSFEIEVPVEDDETTIPDGETTTPDDAGAAVVSEDETTEPGDDVIVPEETPKTETVVHTLAFEPQKDATCEEKGCTGYAYCAECDECTEEAGCNECEKYEAIGKHDIEATGHIFDEDGNCVSCDEIDPVLSCTHMCHSKGIMGTIWSIVKFFTMIFNSKDGRFCDCGAAHW